jgi:hypothetical protein
MLVIQTNAQTATFLVMELLKSIAALVTGGIRPVNVLRKRENQGDR